MSCMEVWGGSQLTERRVEFAGLDTWVYSKPYGQAQRTRCVPEIIDFSHPCDRPPRGTPSDSRLPPCQRWGRYHPRVGSALACQQTANLISDRAALSVQEHSRHVTAEGGLSTALLPRAPRRAEGSRVQPGAVPSCTPLGRPDECIANGNEIAGVPVMLCGSVNWKTG